MSECGIASGRKQFGEASSQFNAQRNRLRRARPVGPSPQLTDCPCSDKRAFTIGKHSVVCDVGSAQLYSLELQCPSIREPT